MLRFWRSLLNTDCEVVRIGDNYVYPIFRNGSTSLTAEADATLINDSISICDDIKVAVRDPIDRFVSGVNQYCQFNDVEVDSTVKKIREGKLIDRHFSPQFVWLLHLSKYHKGTVTLVALEQLKLFTSKNRRPKFKKIQCEVVDDFVSIDKKLLAHLGQTIDLGELIRMYIHEMP